jgi:hypothetical protein
MSNPLVLIIVILLLIALACVCCVGTYGDDKNYANNANKIVNSNGNTRIIKDNSNTSTPTPQPSQTPQIPELEILGFSWKKETPKTQEDESLMLAVLTITIRNNTNKKLGNIYYDTKYLTETGETVYLSSGKGAFYDYITKAIPPKSVRTFTHKDGYINEVAEKVDIRLRRWSEIK